MTWIVIRKTQYIMHAKLRVLHYRVMAVEQAVGSVNAIKVTLQALVMSVRKDSIKIRTTRLISVV